jgi:hypothetical protein
MLIPFYDTRSVYPLPQSRGGGRRQAGACCCGYSCSWLGSSGSENRTERPGHRASSGGSRVWTAPRMEDITDHSPTYKSYWTHWKSLAVRNGILKHHWESVNRWSKAAQIILPWSRGNYMLPKHMVDCQEVTWVSTSPWIRSGKGITGYSQETMLNSGAGSVTPVQPVAAPGTGIGAKCINTMLGPRSKG